MTSPRLPTAESSKDLTPMVQTTICLVLPIIKAIKLDRAQQLVVIEGERGERFVFGAPGEKFNTLIREAYFSLARE